MTKLNPIPDGAVLVGIDVAKIRNEVLIEGLGPQRRRRLSVLNTCTEHDRLIALLTAQAKPVVCAFEATGNYHRPLAWRLAAGAGWLRGQADLLDGARPHPRGSA